MPSVSLSAMSAFLNTGETWLLIARPCNPPLPLLPQNAQDLSSLIAPRQRLSVTEEGFQRIKARKMVFIDSTWQQANAILRVRLASKAVTLSLRANVSHTYVEHVPVFCTVSTLAAAYIFSKHSCCSNSGDTQGGVMPEANCCVRHG